MGKVFLGLLAAGLIVAPALAADGLITLGSAHSVISTMDRL